MYFSISKHVLNTQSVVSKVEQLRPEAPRRFCHIFCSLVPWNSLDLNSFTEPLDTTDLRSKYSCICCFNIIFLCCAPSDILRTQLLNSSGWYECSFKDHPLKRASTLMMKAVPTQWWWHDDLKNLRHPNTGFILHQKKKGASLPGKPHCFEAGGGVFWWEWGSCVGGTSRIEATDLYHRQIVILGKSFHLGFSFLFWQR